MNTEAIDRLVQQARQSTATIVQRGEDVRAKISQLVSEAAGSLSRTRDGLRSLVTVVADGAASGAKDALPEHSEGTLRAVIDGLAEGLAKAAHATQLTLEESGARGIHFAKDDLRKILEDFRAAGDVLSETASAAFSRVGGHAAGQARELAAHAKQTLQNSAPALESAVKAALEHPVDLGRESLQVGATTVRQAAGALFAELGRRLQSAGSPPNP